MVLNLLFTALDCPFKFCFGYDDHKKFYMLGEKKAIWSHNHEMTFKGPTKSRLIELRAFVAKEQAKKTHTPSEIRDKVNSFVKEKKDDEFSISYQKCCIAIGAQNFRLKIVLILILSLF